MTIRMIQIENFENKREFAWYKLFLITLIDLSFLPFIIGLDFGFMHTRKKMKSKQRFSSLVKN